jgi:hypothetical protein
MKFDLLLFLPHSCFLDGSNVSDVVCETDDCFFFQATSAQVEFLRNYPAMAAQLSQMAHALNTAIDL